MEQTEKMTGTKEYDFQRVPPEGRRKTIDMVFLWFGAAMVSQLYIAGCNLGVQTGGFVSGMRCILWGAVFLGIFTSMSGYIGAYTHCNTTLNCRFAFGSKGVALPACYIADIPIYGVIVMALGRVLGILIPTVDPVVWCMIISILLVTNSFVGLKAMVILNKLAFPLLLVTTLYGVFRVHMITPGGLLGIVEVTTIPVMTFAAGVNLVIGTWAAGSSRAADYLRYCRRKRDAFIAIAFGFVTGYTLCIGGGCLFGAATGMSDIGDMLVALGMLGIGSFMFFVQNWTSNEWVGYITQQSVPQTIKILTGKEFPARYMVIFIACFSMIVSTLDLSRIYTPIMNTVAAVMPVIGCVSLVDFFVFNKTKFHWTGHYDVYHMDPNDAELMHHKFNWCWVPAVIIGIAANYMFDFGIPAINGFLSTAVVYIACTLINYSMGVQKKETAKNDCIAPEICE